MQAKLLVCDGNISIEAFKVGVVMPAVSSMEC
jgi:hypothetical protein